MDKAKVRKHYDLYRIAILQEVRSVGNIQYSIFDYEKDTILFIYGSNNRKDWFFNLAFVGLFFHFGYMVLAQRLKKKVKQHKNIVLIGHSMGAGVASILHYMLGKRVIETILTGSPYSYTWLNPIVPKNMTNYRNKGDILRFSKIALLFFRQPKKPFFLPTPFSNPLLNHYYSGYQEAFKKYLKDS